MSKKVRDLKSRVDLRAVWGWEKILCPWHDDTFPSLHIYPDHVYCFACNRAADGITLAMELYDHTFEEAVAWLETYAGEELVDVYVPECPPVAWTQVKEMKYALHKSDTAKGYLEGRGIGFPIATALYLGWDEGYIVIPYIVDGVVKNLKYRRLTEERPKYMTLKHYPCNFLYPIDYFRKHHGDSKVLFLTSGEFDAILLLQAGLPALSVTSGDTTDVLQFVEFLHRFKLVVLLYDVDEQGQKAARKAAKDLFDAGLTVMAYPAWPLEEGKDVTDVRGKLIPKLKTLLPRMVEIIDV